MLDRFFSLKERQTSVRQEIIGGVTTFLTMAYIIVVNPSILAESGMDKNALIAVTCIIAAVSTLLMGFVPRVPIAMAPGMGLNAFFVYTIVQGHGVSWQIALGIVFLAGCLFLLLSMAGIRERLVNAIPKSLITGIGVGIGLFLMFIGLKNLGVVVAHPATFVTLGEFNAEVILGILGLFLMIILYIRKVQGAILLGIVLVTGLSWMGGLVKAPEQFFSFGVDIMPVAFQLDIIGALKISLIPVIFAVLYIDMFDTVGTLVACSQQAGMVKKDGKIEKLSQMLGVDAVATMISGILGSSPTTSYVESATGIAAGGRTGLTSVVTGLLFFTGLLVVPLVGMVPLYATAPALILVGIFMVKEIVHINFDAWDEAIPAVLTAVMMPLTFQISTGIAIGFLSWGLIKLLQLQFKDISITMAVIIGLSLMSLLV